MYSRNKWIYLPYLIFTALLVIATFYDLSINCFLYDPNHLPSLFFERFVLIPPECLIPLTLMAFSRIYQKKILALTALIAFFIIVMHAFQGLLSIENNILISAMLSLTALWFLFQIPTPIWTKHKTFFYYLAFILIITFVMTLSIKQIWGRIRFREMSDPLLEFQPWYVFSGINGHHSFPSNHSAFMTLILCPLFTNAQPKYKTLWIVLCFGLIAYMMLTRMILGAHFLSDTLFGFAIPYTAILIASKIFYYSKEKTHEH